jgi:hypothetical protein
MAETGARIGQPRLRDQVALELEDVRWQKAEPAVHLYPELAGRGHGSERRIVTIEHAVPAAVETRVLRLEPGPESDHPTPCVRGLNVGESIVVGHRCPDPDLRAPRPGASVGIWLKQA